MRYSLRTLLIVMTAAPLWIYLIATIATANRLQRLGGTVLVVAPILLAGITAALYRLTRKTSDGLALAVLLAPMIPLGWILFVRAMNTYLP